MLFVKGWAVDWDEIASCFEGLIFLRTYVDCKGLITTVDPIEAELYFVLRIEGRPCVVYGE